MNTIRNVVFDLGGVLVELDIERCRRAFRDLGMEAVAEIVQPYYPVEVIGRLEGGEISFHEACDEMRRLAGRPDIPDERIAWAYGQFLVDVPVAKLRAVERLRSRGIRTYVLSNNNPASMRFIREMFRADGRTMIDDSGMLPLETLFIDDGAKNIDTARRLGFEVFQPAPGEDFTPLLDRKKY